MGYRKATMVVRRTASGECELTPVGAQRYTLTARNRTYILTDNATGAALRIHNPGPAMLMVLDEQVTGRAA